MAKDLKVFEKFGRRFSELCQSPPLSGKNNKDKGAVFGVSDATISDYMNGKKMPAMEKASIIAVKCGVSIDWLMTGREPKYLTPPAGDALMKAINELSPEDKEALERHALAMIALRDTEAQ